MHLMIIVAYLMYGPYGAFAPYFDSSFATLTRMDSSLLYSVYGDDMGVTYAHRFVAWLLLCLYVCCVCLCLCLCLCVCMCVCTYVYIVCVCACAYVCVYAYVCLCICVYTCVCTHACMCLCVHDLLYLV